ncbi:MarR family winged helix-turn-helix transcriptional regulator [Paenibacillus sp. FJAT-26967]|uniref:MarR family winged helix-turn-helix transcriptional regulator n=1 Tax=Paenibacillus sp. FJAT-26967 TaxID=1729690 RepID=UPI000837DE18|nr:winged helix DNA-binding protein [Paenibacillus sp. FJAT-26967]
MNEDRSSLVKEMIETFTLFAKAEWRKQSVSGIKSSEVRVLLCLKMLNEENDHGVNISDISKRLSVTSPTITQMIKSLINGGYVERYNDAKDKRITLLRLTDKGAEAAMKASERYLLYFSSLIERLGEEQSKTLIYLLNEMYSHSQEIRNADD